MSPPQQHRHRDGITIEDRWATLKRKSGKRWLSRVRDTRLHRYKSKAFHELDAAKAWAKVIRARLELSEASAGTWPLDEVAKEFERVARQEGRTEGYITTMRRVTAMLTKVGVRDLSDDALAAKVRLMLALPTDERHRRQENAAPAESTMRLRFTYVRILVVFAMRQMGMKNDPLMGFALPRRSSGAGASKPSDQESYEPDEVRKILALNDRDNPAWVAFAVAILAGLRAFELHALQWGELDWTARILRVARGKGAKVRHVPLQPELYDLLSSIGGPDAKRPRLGPVVATDAKRLSIIHLRPLLDAADVKWDRGTNEITGLPRRLTWHACRRTCAAASLAAGVDSLEIQRSLGHEEMEMTGEYAGAFARWKAVIAAESWPRGRLCLFGPPSTATAPAPSAIPK